MIFGISVGLSDLTVKNLSVSLDGKSILSDISVNLKSDDRICIVGPNAAGKSIFSKALCFLVPFQGSIMWDGVPAENTLEYCRRSSYLSQNPYFFKGDVLYNLALPLEMRGISTKDSRESVKKQLRDFNLYHLLNENPKKLSIGQRQRLALIRSIVTNPDLLVLDEPTSAIDPESKIWLENTISDFWKQNNMCLLWITHDLLQAKRLADRLLVIRKGSLVLDGEFQEVIKDSYFTRIRDELSLIL